MSIKSRNLIDWNSKNELVAALANMVCICDIDFKHLSKISKFEHDSIVCVLKWTPEGKLLKITHGPHKLISCDLNSGDKIVVCCLNGDVTLYERETAKLVWTCACPCEEEADVEQSRLDFCRANDLVWSPVDSHFIT